MLATYPTVSTITRNSTRSRAQIQDVVNKLYAQTIAQLGAPATMQDIARSYRQGQASPAR